MVQQANGNSSERTAGLGDEQQLVLFQLGGEDYGVNIYSVQRLIQVPEVTRVPHAPEYVEGVIDVRGDIIPVVNLKKRFGFHNTEVGDDGRIVITEVGEQIVGFLVDAVSEVTRLANGDIEPPSAVVSDGKSDFISGIGKQTLSGSTQSRLVIVLDVRKVLALDDIEQLSGALGTADGDQTEEADAPGSTQPQVA